jgi:site-specific DNA-methyltransferase (adenine-specific)
MAEKKYTIIQGDSAQELKNIPDNSIDAVITDPPYGIEFLGKSWDSNTGAVAIWAECLRILKPGGHLLAFSAARTYHHLATNIESVGFEIRDQLMWIYSSGFPKAQDMGRAIQKRLGVKETTQHKNNAPRIGGVAQGEEIKQQEQVLVTDPEAQKWAGWKTALKPGHEPIVMARKRFRGSTTDNIQHHGVGALNIDVSRIPFQDAKDHKSSLGFNSKYDGIVRDGGPLFQGQDAADRKKDIPQAGNRTASFSFGNKATESGGDGSPEFEANPKGRYPSNVMGDIPAYQKYFYCAKVSRRERHCGFEQAQIPDPLSNYSTGDVKNHPLWDPSIGTNLQRLKHKILEHNRDLGKKIPTQDKKGNGLDRVCETCGAPQLRPQLCLCAEKSWVRAIKTGNNHPTVKPVALMRYLIELVTPPGSHVVDPFTGSGTTGMAATELGHRFTGIEQDPHYVEIANKRIQGWLNKDTDKANTATKHTQASQYDRLFE